MVRPVRRNFFGITVLYEPEIYIGHASVICEIKAADLIKFVTSIRKAVGREGNAKFQIYGHDPRTNDEVKVIVAWVQPPERSKLHEAIGKMDYIEWSLPHIPGPPYQGFILGHPGCRGERTTS